MRMQLQETSHPPGYSQSVQWLGWLSICSTSCLTHLLEHHKFVLCCRAPVDFLFISAGVKGKRGWIRPWEAQQVSRWDCKVIWTGGAISKSTSWVQLKCVRFPFLKRLKKTLLTQYRRNKEGKAGLEDFLLQEPSQGAVSWLSLHFLTGKCRWTLFGAADGPFLVLLGPVGRDISEQGVLEVTRDVPCYGLVHKLETLFPLSWRNFHSYFRLDA